MPEADDRTTLLDTFEISEFDLERVREAGTHLIPQLPDFVDDWYAWLRGHDEFETFFGNAPDLLAHVQQRQLEHWTGFFQGKIDDDYVAARRHVGAVHGRIDLPNVIYFAGMFMSDRLLQERLHNVRPVPEQLGAMAAAIEKMVFLDTHLVIDQIYLAEREGAERAAEENALLEARSEELFEQATPVTPIWEGILLLPLVGVLDSSRTQEIMTKTLSMIADSRAKVFMLDISGVRTVDTAVADQLVKITHATRLMGCEAIVSGIAPEIAFTMVELGVDIGRIRTTATLRDAFEIALGIVGDDAHLPRTRRAPDES
ncbi:MAG: protoglobin domain-containing protein [Trueperaceae bacterium]|nr:protoglobin domain-containing protein [Trueperaceae bacterium]